MKEYTKTVIVKTIKKFNFKTLNKIIGVTPKKNNTKLVLTNEYFFINR